MLYDSVKKTCKEKGISVMSLENALNFPRSSICKWNDNEPGVTKVKKVADFLEVSIDKLLEQEVNDGAKNKAT